MRSLPISSRTVPNPVPEPLRVVVLASGTGSLLQALVDAAADPSYPARVVAAGADRDGTPALGRAERAGLPTFVVRPGDHAARHGWDAALADAVGAHAPGLVACAGFMRVLGPAFLARFAGRVLNCHPTLLPAFPGAHGVRDALAYGVKVTGATVHLVDEGVDTGPVLAQACVPVGEDDEAALHERIKGVERELLVDVVARLARHGWSVSGRKASIP